jgi:trehalose-6-phosphate synthase
VNPSNGVFVCGIVLWPLLHYIIWNDATDGRVESKQWEAYAAVNQRYTDLVISNHQPGDVGKQDKKEGIINARVI